MKLKILISCAVLLVFIIIIIIFLFISFQNKENDLECNIMFEEDIIDGFASNWLENCKENYGVNIAYNEIDGVYHYLLTYNQEIKDNKPVNHLSVEVKEKKEDTIIYIETDNDKKSRDYKLIAYFCKDKKIKNLEIFMDGIKIGYDLSKVSINYFK